MCKVLKYVSAGCFETVFQGDKIKVRVLEKNSLRNCLLKGNFVSFVNIVFKMAYKLNLKCQAR